MWTPRASRWLPSGCASSSDTRQRNVSAMRSAAVGSLLLDWYHAGHRDLPWRSSRDPYRVWVSEIMLQQTRAPAVLPPHARFRARCPAMEALGGATEDDVLALWSGLGYY